MKFTKYRLAAGHRPDQLGAKALPSRNKGPTSKGRGRERREGGTGRAEEGKRGERRRRKGRGEGGKGDGRRELLLPT